MNYSDVNCHNITNKNKYKYFKSATNRVCFIYSGISDSVAVNI